MLVVCAWDVEQILEIRFRFRKWPMYTSRLSSQSKQCDGITLLLEQDLPHDGTWKKIKVSKFWSTHQATFIDAKREPVYEVLQVCENWGGCVRLP